MQWTYAYPTVRRREPRTRWAAARQLRRRIPVAYANPFLIVLFPSFYVIGLSSGWQDWGPNRVVGDYPRWRRCFPPPRTSAQLPRGVQRRWKRGAIGLEEHGLEREMCPWAISIMFWWLSVQHIVSELIMCQTSNKCKSYNKVCF
jgi:hypothetical protein